MNIDIETHPLPEMGTDLYRKYIEEYLNFSFKQFLMATDKQETEEEKKEETEGKAEIDPTDYY